MDRHSGVASPHHLCYRGSCCWCFINSQQHKWSDNSKRLNCYCDNCYNCCSRCRRRLLLGLCNRPAHRLHLLLDRRQQPEEGVLKTRSSTSPDDNLSPNDVLLSKTFYLRQFAFSCVEKLYPIFLLYLTTSLSRLIHMTHAAVTDSCISAEIIYFLIFHTSPVFLQPNASNTMHSN